MRRTGAAWLLLAVAGAPLLAAQLPSLPSQGPRARGFCGVRGRCGVLSRRAAAPGRRPDESLRLYLNADASLFGSLTVGVDLLVTTEDGFSLGASGLPGRQNISALGLHPRWKWGSAHLGSFSDSYSPLTWNGVLVRGAAFDLRPGRLQLAAFGGRSAAPVVGGAVNGSYQRAIAGGRVGFGHEQFGRPSTFVALSAVRVWDDPNSLPPPDTTLPPNAPAGQPVPVNPYAVTPEENVVVSASGGVAFLAGKLAWRGELAGAAHSRDVRASELDTSAADIPGVLRGLITPRVGTHADYAFTSELQLRQVRLPGATPRSPRSLTATLAYRHVGPGYTSLGVASMGADLQALDGRANLRFARWSLQLQAGRQNDNLARQKLHTTTRHRLGSTAVLRFSRAWTATLRGNLITMGNGSADSLEWMDYSNWTLGMGHSFSFGPRRTFESLSFDGYYSRAGDANPLRASTDFAALVANARLAIRLGTSMQLTPTVGVSRSQSDTLPTVTRATYGVGAAWRALGGRLSTTGSVSRSTFSATDTWLAVLGSRFQLTQRDDLILNFQVNRYADTATPANGFDEQILNVRWARRL